MSYTPGVDLTMEAFEGYWRKVPSVKRLVFRSMADETTRAAALKAGDVDIVYLLSGPLAEEVKRTPGLKLAAALPPGVVFLDLPEQWDPKSPWHDRRVRLAASHALDRKALNQAETLGLSRPTGALVPTGPRLRESLRASRLRPHSGQEALDRSRLSQRLRRGRPHPVSPFFSLAEAVGNYLQAVGIRTRVRTMERASFLTAWREHKIKGVIMGLGAPAGNAATRIEVYVTKGGIYSSGEVPEIEELYQRQARELDRKKREGLLHQIQQIVHDRVMYVPIYELAFLWGIGPRVGEACVDHIKGFSYSAPYEDLTLKTCGNLEAMIRAHLLVGALGRTLNVERLRLACGLRAPPRIWTLLIALVGFSPTGLLARGDVTMTDELWQKSACDLAEGIARRQFSCAEVMASVAGASAPRTRRSTRSCTTTPRRPWPRRGALTRISRRAGYAARSTASPSRSRRTSTSRASRRRTACRPSSR